MPDFIVITDNKTSSIVTANSASNIINSDNVTTVTTQNPDIVMESSVVTRIVTEGMTGPVGATGPAGPQGLPSEDELTYAKRIDFTINETVIYRGEAIAGSLDSANVWRIRRITIASDNDVTEQWADGADTFTQIWDDRLTLSYS